MDAATLRRLLADRDGGALSDDVMALLAAHLKQAPAAQSEADQYTTMMNDARTAMSNRAQDDLPAFPRAAVETGLRSLLAQAAVDTSPRRAVTLRRPGWLSGLAAAACLALAFLAGRQSQSLPPLAMTSVGTVAIVEPASPPRSGMWSLDAARRSARADVASSAPSWKWSSPLEWRVTRPS